MKKCLLLLFFSLSPFVLFSEALDNSGVTEENKMGSRESVSLKMLSIVLPKGINEAVMYRFGVSEPDWLKYSMISTPLLGYLYTDAPELTALFLPLDAGILAGEWSLSRDSRNWYASNILWMSGRHPIWLATYDIYKRLRGNADPRDYRFDFDPVGIKESLTAPFRFRFFADPVVSIGLGCLMGSALLSNLLAGSSFSFPSGSHVEIYGNEYSTAGGLALYYSSAMYRHYWAGVAEEAYYRGYMLPEFIEYLGPVAGITVESLIFMAVHYSPGMNVLSWFFNYAPPSIFFSLLSYRENFDFQKCTFVHVWYNMFIQFLGMLTQSSISYLNNSSSFREPEFSFYLPFRF